jgi:hypothetical protein
MRVEAVDMSELTRRIEEGIFDPDEFARAIKWVRANCHEAPDRNTPEQTRPRDQKDRDWETVVKMTLIARDLLVGNPRLAEIGFGEEAMGHNAILGGFQGQRHWTDHSPNGDFMEAFLNSSFDWDGIRAPFVFATENDSLNGASMLFGYLLTNTAQVFADVRTYWSPDAVKRVTGHTLEGRAAGGVIHLINSGAASMDAAGHTRRDGQPAMKPFWEITKEEAAGSLDAIKWYPAVTGYFRGGGFSSQFVSPGGMPVTMARINLVHGVGPVLQLAEGWTVELPAKVHEPDVADAMVRSDAHRRGRVPRRLQRHGQLGRQPLRNELRPHRRGSAEHGRSAAHPGQHAQRARREDLPAERLEFPRDFRPRRRRLSRLRELRARIRQELGLSGSSSKGRRCWLGLVSSLPSILARPAVVFCSAAGTGRDSTSAKLTASPTGRSSPWATSTGTCYRSGRRSSPACPAASPEKRTASTG